MMSIFVYTLIDPLTCGEPIVDCDASKSRGVFFALINGAAVEAGGGPAMLGLVAMGSQPNDKENLL